MSATVTIARVVPDILGVNGSLGNAVVLERLLSEMGHQVSVIDVNGPDDVVPQVDIVCVGSGFGSTIQPAATRLLALARPLEQWQASGAYFFAVGVGWDLLGHHLVLPSGETLPGVGIVPSAADHSPGRFSGEVYGLDYQDRPTAGYVNQVGVSTLDEGVQPLLSVEKSAGPWQPTEGLVGPSMMATKLGGPVLSLNPHLALDIIESVLATRELSVTPTEFQARVEKLSSEARRLIDQKLPDTA